MIFVALTVWLVLSVVATGLAGRFLYVCAQADQDAADDLADSDRAVLFAEMSRNFHAAPNSHKEQQDHGA